MNNLVRVLSFLLVLPKGAWAESAFICPVLTQLRTLSTEAYQGTASRSQIADGVAKVQDSLQRPTVLQPLSLIQRRDLEFSTELLLQFAQTPSTVKSVSSTELQAQRSRITMITAELGCNARTYAAAGQAAHASGEAKNEPTGLQERLLSVINQAPGGLATVISLLLMLLVGVTALGFRLARRNEVTQPCHTTGLLKFGDNCSLTNVLGLSKRTAKLQAPDFDLPDGVINLYVAGHQLPVRVKWKNALYLGLGFETPLNETQYEDIRGAKSKDGDIDLLLLNSPSCFAKQCHVDCDLHCPTKVSQPSTLTLDSSGG